VSGCVSVYLTGTFCDCSVEEEEEEGNELKPFFVFSWEGEMGWLIVLMEEVRGGEIREREGVVRLHFLLVRVLIWRV